MPADEPPAADFLTGAIDDRDFGAAGVSQQRSRTDTAVDHVESREDSLDVLRKINEIGLRRRLIERQAFVNHAAIECGAQSFRRTHSDQFSFEPGLPERQRERAADKPYSDD